jgi:zinc protease
MQFPSNPATVEALPNGLRVLLDPDDSFPVVSVQAWVATGSIHEDQHLGAGLSHLLEHMVFKGTREHDGDQLARIVQAAGGQWNAYTSFDQTVYYIDGPAQSLDLFLEVLAGLTFYPTFPEDDFERERDVIRREIDMGLDDPHNVASRLLLETAWLRDPRRHPVIGHRHRFDSLGHADMTAYHARRYTPRNTHFVISGKFDPGTAIKRLADLSADAGDPAAADPRVAEEPPQCAPRFGHATFRVPSSRWFLAWRIPPIDHPDSAALELAASILGRGRSSRLYRGLREDRGLVLEIGSWCWGQTDRPGLLAIQAESTPECRDEAIAAARAEVARLAASPDQAELEKARRQLLASRLRVLTTASGRASELGVNWLATRDPDFTRRRLEALDRVTTDDLARAAAGLVEERLTTTILDPENSPAAGSAKRANHQRPEPSITHLDNGLTVIGIPDKRLPLASVQLVARAGLPAETTATSGIGQLLAATLPHGSSSRNGAEIASALESLGASLACSAGNNYLLAGCGGLAPDLPELVATLGELAVDPAFPADAVARELASQRTALDEALDDPLSTALRLARSGLFGTAGYGLEPLGSAESLDTLDRESLATHHREHFRGPNLVAAVAGDFGDQDPTDLLADTFAQLPAGDPWTPPPSEIHPDGESGTELPKRQAAIAMAFPTGPAAADEHPALELLHHHCADMAGPLFTRIREELGLAYHVSAMRIPGFDAGTLVFFLATAPSRPNSPKTPCARNSPGSPPRASTPKPSKAAATTPSPPSPWPPKAPAAWPAPPPSTPSSASAPTTRSATPT